MTTRLHAATASPRVLRGLWIAAGSAALGSRIWNALSMPILRGYDATGHVAYVLFLDLYRAVPHADQGWSYFHPPLHYVFGFLLAQSGSAEVLVRGLALLGSAASLGMAALAAWLVRRGLPARPGLAILAFLAVAFLPVEVYASTMPGNELTAAGLASVALAAFLYNEMRPEPSRANDALTGLAAGLSLLAKFSGLLVWIVIFAALALRALRPGAGLATAAKRALLIGGVAVLVCLPYYARNLEVFGTAFQLSRDFPLVESVESIQPPGERGPRDLVSFPLRTFLEPNPEAEHLLHSIWGTLYVNTWLDARPGIEQPLARTLVLAGLPATALALLGFALCLPAALRRERPVELTLVLLTLAGVGALLIMAYRVPTFAMLKASYLLNLSLAYGFFVARGVAALGGGARAAGGLVLAACALSALASAPGVLRPAGGENERMAAVHTYFGDYAQAASIYRGRIPEMKRPARRNWMRENLAGVLVQSGEVEEARAIYDARKRIFAAPPHLEEIHSPWLLSRRAVATALAGDLPAALHLLERGIAGAADPPLLVNRAALRALLGDLDAAESDLRAALDGEPGLPPAWRNLAFVQAARGEGEQAARSLSKARQLSFAAPRGFPYGVGNGFHLNGQRFMLVVDAGKLALYRPGRARGGSL